MYLNGTKWDHVTESGGERVFTVFLRNIHLDERFLGNPPKEVLHLDIAKCILLER